MKYRVDTSGWKAEYLKFEFQPTVIEPAKVYLFKTDLESFSNGNFVLKKTKKAGYPYLPLVLEHEGGRRKRIVLAGPPAYQLLEVAVFEESENAFIAYVRMEGGKFIQIDAFAP